MISWLNSYLSDRLQCVKLDHCLLNMKSFPLVFHRGLFLDRFFSLSIYTGPFSRVIPSRLVPHHLYVDDTQLYISFSAGNSESSSYRPQQCFISIQDCMTTNKLKLNPEKSELLFIGHERRRLKYLSTFPITPLESETHASKTAKNLGIVFDENFNFRTHINSICKHSYCHIRNLRRIKKTFEPGPSQVPGVCGCVQAA